MAVKKNKPTFTAGGREFDTLSEAERHETLSTAREKVEDAARVYQKALGESAKTADGFPFEFGLFRDYWLIVSRFDTRPYLEKFSYFCWSWSVRESEDVIQIREDKADGKDSRFIPIIDLYADAAAAKFALLAEQRKWLGRMQELVEDFAREITK